jgi:hypothetical protein
MPDAQGKTLPPLPEESFDGHREEAAIPRDKPLEKTCEHKDVQIVSSTEIKCACGSGWSGPDILELYKQLRG